MIKKSELTKSTYFSQVLLNGNFTVTSCIRNRHLLMNEMHDAMIGLRVVINQNLFKKEVNHDNQ